MDAPRPEMLLPPWLSAGTPKVPLRDAITRAKGLLATYWLFLVSGYVALVGAGFYYWADPKLLWGLALVIAMSTAGVALGNVTAMLRVRAWIIQVVVWGALIASCTTALLMGPVVALSLVSFLTGVGCGHMALQRGSLLGTLWVPTVGWATAILTVLEHNHRLATWRAGDKSGVWQPVTLGLLLAFITLFFFFLAGQERYHGRVWIAGGSTGATSVTWRRAEGGLRLRVRGVIAIALAAVLVTGAVALVAPYLWRTAPAQPNGQREAPPEPERGEGRERPADEGEQRRPRFDGEGLRRAIERAARRAREQGGAVLPFLPLFLLNRPLRRWWLLRRLRRSKGVSPSRRASNRWRQIVIAMGDAGVEPKQADTVDDAIEHMERARERQGLAPSQGLATFGEHYQRVRYGLGIPPGALDAMDREAESAYRDLRAPLGRWRRVKGWWRRIEG